MYLTWVHVYNIINEIIYDIEITKKTADFCIYFFPYGVSPFGGKINELPCLENASSFCILYDNFDKKFYLVL